MKRYFYILISLIVALSSSGCASYKDIVYFQNIGESNLQPTTPNYETVIQKDDKLSIIVSGPDKTVVSPYNLTMSESSSGFGGGSPEAVTLTYHVDINGDIDFPILGKIHAEGMTRSQLARYLEREISKDVLNPIVYVEFKNFKLTILGEVRNPGTYTIDSEKTSILQALGKAGDLTLNAERDNILLIREVDGKQRHYKIDLKDAALLESPFFYLQQNDVIVVPPSPRRVKAATTVTGIWSVILTSITTAIALITLTLTLLKLGK